jgi:uncharacterized protein (DUF1697 family)
MNTYFTILRGINVSGKKLIKMVDLKQIYEKVGFKNVHTYIQSGNVVFNSELNSCDDIIKIIQKAINEKYDFDVPIIAFSLEYLNRTISNNPYLNKKDVDTEKLHITFLSNIPSSEKVAKISDLDFSPDSFVLDGDLIYVYCPNGYGNTKLSNTFFENKLKTSATTRNWKSVNKLKEVYDLNFIS